MDKQKQALVVTTEHRGVFFGYGVPSDAKTIELENVRMCVSWPTENRGMVGLAADGPKSGSRISPAAPSVILQDVTAVFVASKNAVKEWESGKWQ